MEISQEEIARRAYARWEDSDRTPGRDQEHWFAAEQELGRGNPAPDPGGAAAAPDDEEF